MSRRRIVKNSEEVKLFSEVEELVGTYPSGDALRNALHAILTWDVDIWSDGNGIPYGPSDPTEISFNHDIEAIARYYESDRGTHMHIKGSYAVENFTVENYKGPKAAAGRKICATYTVCNEDCNRPD